MLPGVEDAILNRRALGWVMNRLWRGVASRYRVTVLTAREAVLAGSTTEQMAQDAAEALLALGRQPRITAGMGAGGLAALWMAARAPDLTGALVVLSTPLSARVPEPFVRFLDHLAHLLRDGQWPQAFEHACGVYLESDLRRRLSLVLRLLKRWGQPDDLQRAARILSAFRSHDGRSVLARVTVPVLAFGGGLDPMLPMTVPGSTPALNGTEVRPSRQVWLAGEHGAFLTFWQTVVAELNRFSAEYTATPEAVRP